MYNRKIIVAGAGHGGIVCAAFLAEKGYDVTVFEKKNREDLGYDWHDVIYHTLFTQLGVDFPETDKIIPYFHLAFTNPSKSSKIERTDRNIQNYYVADRKYLINFLIDYALDKGVKFEFDTAVTSAIINDGSVKGIITEKGEFFADMVIDAAGMDSPVRSSLPAEFGIDNHISPDKVFYVYRAYYNKTADKFLDPHQLTYFYPCYRKGMDWIITENDFIDVLIGGFEPIDMDDVNRSLESMKQDCPYLGTNVLRGGQFNRIPLRRMMAKFVGNGYAAVGDSAFMTEPMSGSGINKSIDAGIELSKVIESIGDDDFTVDRLWKYQYNYMKNKGKSIISDEMTKNMLTSFSGKDLDFLFDKKILTWKVMKYSGISHDTKSEIIHKARVLIFRPDIVKKLLKFVNKLKEKNIVIETLPEEYSDYEFLKWAEKYNNI